MLLPATVTKIVGKWPFLQHQPLEEVAGTSQTTGAHAYYVTTHSAPRPKQV